MHIAPAMVSRVTRRWCRMRQPMANGARQHEDRGEQDLDAVGLVAPAERGSDGDEEGDGDGDLHACAGGGPGTREVWNASRTVRRRAPLGRSARPRPDHSTLSDDVVEDEQDEEQDVGVGRTAARRSSWRGRSPARSSLPSTSVLDGRRAGGRTATALALHAAHHGHGEGRNGRTFGCGPAGPGVLRLDSAGLVGDEAAGLGGDCERTAFGREARRRSSVAGWPAAPVWIRGPRPRRR